MAIRLTSIWSGGLLGFAMGGFFDGILLHQILQWHHLFSALESDPFLDLRVQILADGLFHGLMYVLLSIGVWKLWQAYRRQEGINGRVLGTYFLIGFGFWHVVDAVFSHWLFGIHRIRPQSDVPLLWDLLFFIGLGLVPILLGFYLRRDVRRRTYPSAPLLLIISVMTAAAFAAIPWKNTRVVAVIFRPGISASEVFAAADSVDARLMRSNKNGDVWVFAVPDNRSAWLLYWHGAWFVSGSFFGVGCFSPPARTL